MERHNEPVSGKRRDFFKQITGGMAGLAVGLGLPEVSEAQYTPGSGQKAKKEKIIINRVETIIVQVPGKNNMLRYPELENNFRNVWYNCLIKLYGDNGFVGIGEVTRNFSEKAVKENSQFLTGKDVLSLNFAHPTLELPQRGGLDGFEMAIFDLIGKTWGVPVYMLLGGKFQDKVAVAYWTGRPTGKEMERHARQAVDMGYKSIKFKQRPEDSMVDQVRSINKAAPELGIIVDPNRHFQDYNVFLRQAKQLEGYNIMCMEDPMPHDVDTYLRLNEELSYPVGMHVQANNFSLIADAIKAGACNIFNMVGNMRTFVRHCNIIDGFGCKCWQGSNIEIGVKDAAYLHGITATRNCTLPSDVLGYLIRENDLLSKTFAVKDGYATLPDAPGLGVELDEDAIKKYRV